jgi:chemotaxis methyl-accepting protein methylase
MYQNQNNPFIKNIIENFEKNKKSSNLTDPEINNIHEVLKFEKMEDYLSLLKTNLDSFDQFLNLTDTNLTQIGVKLGHRIKILRSITK